MHYYFGNETDNLYLDGKYANEKFLALQKKIAVDNLFFLKQTHSATVFIVNKQTPLDLFRFDGDAIITAEKNIGIGVATADCLPIALHDIEHEAIGIIHAG